VKELTRPFVQLWDYVEQVGGYPGQIFFVVTVLIVVFGVLTWYGNKR
jgi:hypothetical protein